MKCAFPNHVHLVDKHFHNLKTKGVVCKFTRDNLKTNDENNDNLLKKLKFDEFIKMIAEKSGRRLTELPSQTGPTLITLSFVILAAMFVGLYFIKRWFQKRTRRDSFGF